MCSTQSREGSFLGISIHIKLLVRGKVVILQRTTYFSLFADIFFDFNSFKTLCLNWTLRYATIQIFCSHQKHVPYRKNSFMCWSWFSFFLWSKNSTACKIYFFLQNKKVPRTHYFQGTHLIIQYCVRGQSKIADSWCVIRER